MPHPDGWRACQEITRLRPPIAIQYGRLDQARHRSGCGIADGNGLDDVIALEHRAHPIQELNRINLRAIDNAKNVR